MPLWSLRSPEHFVVVPVNDWRGRVDAATGYKDTPLPLLLSK